MQTMAMDYQPQDSQSNLTPTQVPELGSGLGQGVWLKRRIVKVTYPREGMGRSIEDGHGPFLGTDEENVPNPKQIQGLIKGLKGKLQLVQERLQGGPVGGLDQLEPVDSNINMEKAVAPTMTMKKEKSKSKKKQKQFSTILGIAAGLLQPTPSPSDNNMGQQGYPAMTRAQRHVSQERLHCGPDDGFDQLEPFDSNINMGRAFAPTMTMKKNKSKSKSGKRREKDISNILTIAAGVLNQTRTPPNNNMGQQGYPAMTRAAPFGQRQWDPSINYCL